MVAGTGVRIGVGAGEGAGTEVGVGDVTGSGVGEGDGVVTGAGAGTGVCAGTGAGADWQPATINSSRKRAITTYPCFTFNHLYSNFTLLNVLTV